MRVCTPRVCMHDPPLFSRGWVSGGGGLHARVFIPRGVQVWVTPRRHVLTWGRWDERMTPDARRFRKTPHTPARRRARRAVASHAGRRRS